MTQRNQSEERGGARLNFALALLFLGFLIFVGVKLVPVYFANYQLQDAIESESRFALTGYPKKSADDVQNDVMSKAQELGVPVKRDDVQVIMDGGRVDITLQYSVPIDLAVYQFSLQFHLHADNHTI